MSNKISKKDFLKISTSSFLFLFIGGLGFINSFFKSSNNSAVTQTIAKGEKPKYGSSSYGG